MRWLKYAVAVSLLAIAFFLGTFMPRAEATSNEVVITYLPEIGSVCLSNASHLICDHWQNFVEKGMYDTRADAWNSIFGATH